jgi:hypothetical protein
MTHKLERMSAEAVHRELGLLFREQRGWKLLQVP